jgi:hypothetical protein
MDIFRLNDLMQRLTAILTIFAALAAGAAYWTGRKVQSASDAQIFSLQKEIKGRVLTDGQLATLIALLKSVPKPDKPVDIYGPPGVAEGIRLAKSLKGCFVAAGFTVRGVWEDAPIGGAGPGILIRQRFKDDPIGLGIAAALKAAAGLDSRIVELGSTFPESKVEIFASYAP